MRRSLVPILGVCAVVASASQISLGPVKPTALDTSERGVYRCTFEAAPPVGTVFVLRHTATRGTYVYSKCDMVQYSSGDKLTEPIIVTDPSQQRGAAEAGSRRTSVQFKAAHGGGELTGMRVTSATLKDGILTFDFVGEGREPVRFVFEGFIESYASAKARIRDLRDMPKPGADGITGWLHSTDIREKKRR